MSSILDDFPQQKPSSYWGTHFITFHYPKWMETSILPIASNQKLLTFAHFKKTPSASNKTAANVEGKPVPIIKIIPTPLATYLDLFGWFFGMTNSNKSISKVQFKALASCNSAQNFNSLFSRRRSNFAEKTLAQQSSSYDH